MRGALVASTLMVGWAVGCSGSSGDSSSPCDSIYKGKCGGACKSDADCAAGIYCGSSGTCNADCAPGHACPTGESCTPDGHCDSSTGLFGSDGGGLTSGLNDASACVTDRRSGEGLPSDIYIMNDQSLSMTCAIPSGGDRWQAMVGALTNFLQSPNALGLGVGIQYFGLGSGQGSCDPAVYTPADVEIAPLPGNAQPIIASLNAHKPVSYTPTPAALQGAIDHAQAWAKKYPDHHVSVVLATDGEPNLCGTNGDNQSAALINQVAAIAAAAFNATPSIPTYVIGIIGGSAANGGQGCNLDPAPPNKADLDKVAAAGGTGTAFVVDATTTSTSAEFLDALNSIRGAATIPCVYVLPTTTSDGRQIDPNQVNISLTPSGGAEQHLLQSPSAAACDPTAGGWYYDPSDATHIDLCPASCDIVKSDTKAALDVLLGCVTQTEHVN